MKYVTGFFMAWGNFLTLPCPLKRWNSDYKNIMLAFLPAVGVVIGLLWMALYWVLKQIQIPQIITCFIMEFYIFAVCGFMHLDGFMDCNDAILSRRPLEDRQRILKDSNVGAFAVVSVIFLLLGWFASMMVAVKDLTYMELLVLPVTSRSIAGLFVLSCKPIGHSQYVEDFKKTDKARYRIALLVQLAIAIGIACYFGGRWIKTAEFVGTIVIFGIIACSYARKQLGGMSGDIAGYTICISEFMGLLVLACL